jgi:aspartate/methionine/tyrosine aminotransferase
MKAGVPISLSASLDAIPVLSASESLAYAPTAGVEETRKIWREQILAKNPGVDAETIGLPIVVPGITAGISYIADLFLDENSEIISSDPCWDNYDLIFETRRGAVVRKIAMVTGEAFAPESGLKLTAIKRALETQAALQGRVKLILNFPNNPSGYTPTRGEAAMLIGMIKDCAESGADVLVVCDDAYFGFFYEDSCVKESLFGALSKLHERVLAVKIDGPTKEDYVWGWRCGFVTFGGRGLKPEHHEALTKKMMGVIRSSVSCSNSPAQRLIRQVLNDDRTAAEKTQNFAELKNRYEAVKKCVMSHGQNRALLALPFNSGYFMSFRCSGFKAEELRKCLLKNDGIGLIAFGEGIVRIAFSSLDLEKIPEVFDKIYAGAEGLFDGKIDG